MHLNHFHFFPQTVSVMTCFSVCLLHHIQCVGILCLVHSHWRDNFSRFHCHWHVLPISIHGSYHLWRWNYAASTHQRRQHTIQVHGSGKPVISCTISLHLNLYDQVWFSADFKVAFRCSFAQTDHFVTRAEVWQKGSMIDQASNYSRKRKI